MGFLSKIIGLFSFIGGLFFAYKYKEKSDEVEDLKVQKKKAIIEKENEIVKNTQLKDDIKIKDFEAKNDIEEPKVDEVQKEVEKELQIEENHKKEEDFQSKIPKENLYKIEL